MGQYHYTVNLDKREYLDPHKFGDGLKLMECGASGGGTLMALAVLLAEQNRGGARGGGDLHPWTEAERWGEDRTLPVTGREDYLMTEIVGRWAGDRVTIIGDYWEAENDPVAAAVDGGPWSERSGEEWTDISEDVLAAMRLDYYTNRDYAEQEATRAKLRADMII